MNAEIICVQGADSAAAAYASGVQRAGQSWHLLVHQDVYFPTGSGFTLARQLGALEQAGRTAAPAGFVGVEVTAPNAVRHAGLVIDRTALFAHRGSGGAASIDDFAVALHRDSCAAIDPALGWHLWATDLCLQARQQAGRDTVPILEVPLFHNSTTAYQLPVEFHASAQRLLDKHPRLERIPTLCGELKRQVAAVRLPGPRPRAVRNDLCHVHRPRNPTPPARFSAMLGQLTLPNTEVGANLTRQFLTPALLREGLTGKPSSE